MLITLGGKAGSGKSTIADTLAEKLGYQIISIGNMKRQLAEEMGISIQQFSLLGDLPANQAEFDLKYEEYQKNLKLTDDIILDSRLGFYAQPNAFKVFLNVRDEVASERIRNAHRQTEASSSPTQALKELKERNKSDHDRYLRLYNIDLRDPTNYTLFLDTSDQTPEAVVNTIIQQFNAKK